MPVISVGSLVGRNRVTIPRALVRGRVAWPIAPTVAGRLAYFDDEAQTYMVLTRDGVLVSAPCCP
jgi:hypothetical protein